LPLGLLDLLGGLLALGVLLDLLEDGVEELGDALELVLVETLLPLGEVGLGLVGILLLELAPVLVDVDAVDARVVDLGVLLALLVALDLLEAGELLHGVGHVHARVDAALHRAEDLVAGRDARDADIQLGLERLAQALLALCLQRVLLLHHVLALAVGGVGTLEELVEGQLLQEALAEQEAGEVGGGVVLEACGHAVVGEFATVCALKDFVAREGGPDDLGLDAHVGEADDQAVARGVVLILVLLDEFGAQFVVGQPIDSSFTRQLFPGELR
jgi:hypothetical protein